MPSFQPVKKASQNLPPMAAKKVKIVFCRGAYLAENTSQAPSARLLRPGGKCSITTRLAFDFVL